MTPRYRNFVVFLAFSALAGALLWFAPRPPGTAADSETVTVTLGDIEEVVSAQGKLEAKEFVDIGAQVTGQLQKIYVQIGDNVQAGQLLAQIDPRIYQARVEAGQANIKNLQAQLAGQQAQTKFARQQYERNVELIQTDSVSLQDLQNSEYNLKSSIAAEASIKAQTAQIQSALNGDRANLDFTKIYAPIASTMVDQKAREGQTLNANQQTPTILQLARLDTMTVRAQVAEADIMRLNVGMPVYFTTLGSGERRWQASVRQILPTPEIINNVVLYHVLIDVNNQDRQLMTSMTAQLFFVLGQARQVPLVPLTALGARVPAEDNADGMAFRVKERIGQTSVEKTIRIGLKTRRVAQIRDGLGAGAKLVINPLQEGGKNQGGSLRPQATK